GHGRHHVVDRPGAVRRVAHDQVEHGAEQLPLQVRAGAVVAQRAGRRAIGDHAHALGREATVARAPEVAAHQPFEGRDAARVERPNTGATAPRASRSIALTSAVVSKAAAPGSGQYTTRCGTPSTAKRQLLSWPTSIWESTSTAALGAKNVRGSAVGSSPVTASQVDGS